MLCYTDIERSFCRVLLEHNKVHVPCWIFFPHLRRDLLNPDFPATYQDLVDLSRTSVAESFGSLRTSVVIFWIQIFLYRIQIFPHPWIHVRVSLAIFVYFAHVISQWLAFNSMRGRQTDHPSSPIYWYMLFYSRQRNLGHPPRVRTWTLQYDGRMRTTIAV